MGLNVKINTVVIRGWNDDEIVDFANFARDTGHVVRFIEFMRLDGSGVWQVDMVYSKKEMIDRIARNVEAVTPLNNSSACDLSDSKEKIYDNNNNSYKHHSRGQESDPATLFSYCD